MELTTHAVRAILARLTNRTVADALGISHTTVSRWRGGSRAIPLEAAATIVGLAGGHLVVVERDDITAEQRQLLSDANAEWSRAVGVDPRTFATRPRAGVIGPERQLAPPPAKGSRVDVIA